MAKAVELLDTIPGIAETVAQIIVSEIGVDMSRFATEKHLSSWAGICPSNRESAGKRKEGRILKSNTYLKGGAGAGSVGSLSSEGYILSGQVQEAGQEDGQEEGAGSCSAFAVGDNLQHIEGKRELQGIGSRLPGQEECGEPAPKIDSATGGTRFESDG